MSILAWIIFGIIAGFIASKIVNKQGEGLLMNMVLGIVGAMVGGFIFNRDVNGFNLTSMLVAVIGAVIVLVAYHMITGRRATYR